MYGSYGLFIDGAWSGPAQAASTEIADPATGAVLGTVPAGFNMTVDTSTAGQVNLIVTAISGTYWDGPATNTTSVEGGIGTLNASSRNWTTSTGTPNGVWAGGSSVAKYNMLAA